MDPGQFLKNLSIGPILFRLQERSFVRRGLLSLLLLSIVVVAFRVPYQESKSQFFMTRSRSDFDDYFGAARLLYKGEDPYRLENLERIRAKKWKPEDLFNPLKLQELAGDLSGFGSYLYPPFTAFLLMPLSSLNYTNAALVYQFFSVLAFLGSLLYMYLAISRNSHPSDKKDRVFRELSLLGSILVILSFLHGNASNGNIAFFLILLMGTGLVLSYHAKIFVEFLGGVLLGVATAMKITPGFLGLLLLGGRRYTAILGMGAGLLFALILPATAFGWDGNLELTIHWKNLILDNYSKHVIVRPWANNQSVPGMFGKYFLPGSDVKQSIYGLPFFDVGFPVPKPYLKVVVGWVRTINYSLVLIGIASSLFLAFLNRLNFKGKNPLEQAVFVRYSMFVMLISLLAAGVSWSHAYSILFIPIYYRFYLHLKKDEKMKRGEVLFYGSLAFFGIILSFFGGWIRDAFAMYSVFVWVALMGALYHLFLVFADSLTKKNREGNGGI